MKNLEWRYRDDDSTCATTIAVMAILILRVTVLLGIVILPGLPVTIRAGLCCGDVFADSADISIALPTRAIINARTRRLRRHLGRARLARSCGASSSVLTFGTALHGICDFHVGKDAIGGDSHVIDVVFAYACITC